MTGVRSIVAAGVAALALAAGASAKLVRFAPDSSLCSGGQIDEIDGEQAWRMNGTAESLFAECEAVTVGSILSARTFTVEAKIALAENFTGWFPVADNGEGTIFEMFYKLTASPDQEGFNMQISAMQMIYTEPVSSAFHDGPLVATVVCVDYRCDGYVNGVFYGFTDRTHLDTKIVSTETPFTIGKGPSRGSREFADGEVYWMTFEDRPVHPDTPRVVLSPRTGLCTAGVIEPVNGVEGWSFTGSVSAAHAVTCVAPDALDIINKKTFTIDAHVKVANFVDGVFPMMSSQDGVGLQVTSDEASEPRFGVEWSQGEKNLRFASFTDRNIESISLNCTDALCSCSVNGKLVGTGDLSNSGSPINNAITLALGDVGGSTFANGHIFSIVVEGVVEAPTASPTASPTTPAPSSSPSKSPTGSPTTRPSVSPTNKPTPQPTNSGAATNSAAAVLATVILAVLFSAM